MRLRYNYHIQLRIYLIFLVILISGGCKKILEVDPPTTSITGASVYNTDATAIAVLTNMYATLSSAQFYTPVGITTLSMYAGLSADEFTLWSGVTDAKKIAYYTNSLSANANVNTGAEYWDFTTIYKCNEAISQLTATSSLTPAVKKQLLGEAKFLRAFFNFYMVNLYGDIPLITSTDYKENTLLTRSPKAKVYQQIISDLLESQNLLSQSYLNGSLLPYAAGTVERVRPTTWAATSLLARVYLYAGEWVNAEAQATTIINNSTLFSLSTLNNAFLKASLGNNEAIWQLQPVTSGTITNTQDGYYFMIPTTGPNNNSLPGNNIYLSDTLLKSFETNDQRKTIGNWVNSRTIGTVTYYYPYKYKASSAAGVTEYSMVLRLAEQYLIRSEARAQLNNIAGAQSDLNTIRTRAQLGSTTASDKNTLLSAILHERQVELFSELGHRWLDLKRTGNVDAVMSVVTPRKGGVWSSYQQLYPVKYSDILTAPNLTQNLGY